MKYLPALTAGDALVPTILGLYEEDDNVVERTTAEMAGKTAESRFDNLFSTARDEKGKIVYDTEDVPCLREMIRLSKDLGCVPGLFTPPYLKEFMMEVKENGPDLLDAFYETIHEIVEQERINYFDWSQDKQFYEAYQLFTNLYHLNRDGIQQFTEILIDTVK